MTITKRITTAAVAIAVGAIFAHPVSSQDKSATSPPAATVSLAPVTLPGKGLAQHDFLYAGEGKDQRMYIVRNGTIVWSYANPGAQGEISDAVLMSNGNILFAHQFGVTMITSEKKIIWNYDAPEGAEIHTAQPIGHDKVLFIQNGNPALLRVVSIMTGKTVTEFNLPVGNPQKVHPQFRHARITEAGTVLVAHLDMQKVVEYDAQGREVWSYSIDGPWSAARLKNGNTLIATSKKVIREVDSKGTTVWELKPEDLPDYRISNFQIATRLANGNTVLNNWANIKPADDRTNGPVQAVEVTADKRIVWALRSWTDPNDLGPATTIQLLDKPSAPEKVHFGEIR